MKATFFERLGAYVIDIVIIYFILWVIGLGFGNNTSETEKLMQDLDNQLLNSQITLTEYLDEYKVAFYDYQKENVLELGISVALTIAYFVVFQYMNKGQTIGKKLLKIKVVDKKNKKPITILKGLLRSFIVLSILSGVLNIAFLYIFNTNNYFNVYGAIVTLELTFTIISIMFILYKNDKRGLHDIMTNTMVIKESR